ncbi:MAG TPA: hypothetical protein DEF34_12850 [Desulfotomaculum sp.]|nr:MAG: hypothetical protein VR67_01915 [Peptococcaceae bacterium BRH_c8a]KJS75822.1 MAG: hypothetical protein JL56_06805 [Desulfotomaculum sp. BICA1-6]HBX24499.1 hypothetical protein [Desulfotomaculum sp.]
MDWEDKYLDKLEKDLSDIRRHIDGVEHKITDSLDRSMTRLVIANKERLDEYMTLNQRLDSLSGKVDRSLQWTVKFTVGTILAVCGLILAVVVKLV